MTTVRVYGGKAATKRAEGSPLLAGLLAAIGIIVVWVGLVYVTHHPVGVAAWGVGGLLGLVVAKVATPPTKASGALAAVLTFFTVLLAKVVVVVVALQPIIRHDLVADTTLFGPGYELREQMIHEAAVEARASSFDERNRLIHVYFDKFLDRLGFWVLLWKTFGVLDLLWIGLGISTAWTLGQGRICLSFPLPARALPVRALPGRVAPG